MELVSILELEPHGPDTFVGHGPRYPWGGLYGGQIVAQALRAAAETVAPGYHPHSCHAYFIRRGDHDAPVRYEVDRLRDGRSFTTRRVVARQAVGAILNLSASFQRDETEAEAIVTEPPTGVGRPDELADETWSPAFDRRFVGGSDRGHAMAWLKVVGDLGDDPLLHACGLAFVSDDLPTDAATSRHPEWQGREATVSAFMTASLDHTIWFHQPFRADRWNLYEFRCDVLRGARAHTAGRVFDESGRLVATVAQEVLIRRRHDG